MEVTDPAARPEHRRGVRAAAFILGLVVALALTEGALRAMGQEWPVFHRPDRELGMVPIPGARGRFVSEGDAWVSMNDEGFRDTSHLRVAPAGTFRIAILGDSYAEALQVPRDSTFWSVLAAELAGCPPLEERRVEVLNFGVSGYSTGQEFLVLRDRVWAYRPDLVLIAVLTGNDIADNSPALTAAPIPFVRATGRDLSIDRSRTRSPGAVERAVFRLLPHSRLAQLVNVARLRVKACRSPLGCAGVPTAPGEGGLRNDVYLPPTDPAWHEAWRVTETLLAGMRDSARARRADLRMVILSNSIQVHPDTAVREGFRRAIGAASLLYPDHRLTAFAEANDIPALALAPEFAERAAREGIFLHGWPGPRLGTGHWNPLGHRLAGETIARWICEGARGDG